MSNNEQPMTVLSKRLLDLSEQCNAEIKNIFDEYENLDSVIYNNVELATEKLQEIKKRYKDREWDIIDEETSKPIIRYLTEDQILMEYGDVISKEELNNIMKKWKQD